MKRLAVFCLIATVLAMGRFAAPATADAIALEFKYTRVVQELSGNAAPPAGCRAEEFGGRRFAIEETVVTSREHLLQLMGVRAERDLSRGQRALLEAFEQRQTQGMRNLMDLAGRCGTTRAPNGRIGVRLIDTTFVNGISQDELLSLFWPRAGQAIILSSPFGDRYSSSAIESVLAHEVAHMLDNPQLSGSTRPQYGPDGRHHINERTQPIVAFCEGWAEYIEALLFGGQTGPMTEIRFEDPNRPGAYSDRRTSSAEVTGQDMISTEGVIARMLYNLARTIPGGEARVADIFARTNGRQPRDIVSFLNVWLNTYPDDAAQIMRVFDEMTLSKFSNDELRRMFSQRGVATYVAGRREGRGAPAGGAPVPGNSGTGIGLGTQPLDHTKLPPGGDNTKLPPGGDNTKLPPGGDNTKLPPGGDNTKLPPGGDNTKLPPGGDNTKLPPGSDNTKLPPGGDNTKLPPGGDNTKLPPGGDNTKLPPGGDNTKLPPGGDNTKLPPKGDDTRLPPKGDDGKVPPKDGKMGKKEPPVGTKTGTAVKPGPGEVKPGIGSGKPVDNAKSGTGTSTDTATATADTGTGGAVGSSTGSGSGADGQSQQGLDEQF